MNQMSKTLSLIKREFKTRVLTKGFWISTILMPVILIGIIFMPALFQLYSEDKPTVVQVIDRSGDLSGEISGIFNDTLSNGQPRYLVTPLNSEIYEADKEIFHRAIEEGATDALLIIPEDILEQGEIIAITASLGQGDFLRLAQQRISAAANKIRLQRAGLDPGEIENLTRRIGLKTVQISGGKESEKGFDEVWTVTFTFLMILYTTIIVYGAAVMRGVLEEKTSRILEVLLSSGNSFQLMMGKLFGVGSVGLAQYLVWGVLGLLVFGYAAVSAPHLLNYVAISPLTFVYFILFFLIGYFQFSVLYAAVGAMCSSQEDAQAVSVPVTLLVVIPFVISISLGLSDASSTLTRVLSLLPFFAPMLMFLRIQLSNPALWEIGAAVLLNVLAIFALTWLAAKIYRVGVLSYGKRPTLPEILRWLRYR